MREQQQPPVGDASLDPENWVDAHGDVLFRYALARVANPEMAEELVQETFLAALSGREQFGSRSSERTWLVGTRGAKSTES